MIRLRGFYEVGGTSFVGLGWGRIFWMTNGEVLGLGFSRVWGLNCSRFRSNLRNSINSRRV